MTRKPNEAVADALNVTVQIVESNQGFAPLTIVYPVQERNTSSTITIGHIDECHYVSTTALQSNASISMCNVLCLLSFQIHNVFAKKKCD